MAMSAWDVTGKTGPAFLEFCDGKLIDYEDAAARGEPGMAENAATLRRSGRPPLPGGGRVLFGVPWHVGASMTAGAAICYHFVTTRCNIVIFPIDFSVLTTY
jgi:hypothetical protein